MKRVTIQWRNYIEMTTAKTIVKCLRVVTRRNVVYGTTMHTRPFKLSGIVYQPSIGLSDTAIARTEGFSPDNLEFSLLLTEQMSIDLEAGKFDGAKCYFFLVDYTDLTKKEIPLATGYIGEISKDQGIVKAEILGLMARLSRKSGRTYTIECDARLGDNRCQVQMTDISWLRSYTLNATLRTITRNDTGSFSIDGFKQGSKIQIIGSTLGNDGFYTVESIDPTFLTVIEPIPSNETASLTLSLIANLTYTKTVASIDPLSPKRKFTMNSNTKTTGEPMPDQWLFAGVITFQTGLNAGDFRDVSNHLGTSLECYLDFPFAIAEGDTFTVSTGCDMLFETCKTKFNNAVNHRGFPLCPTNEDIFSTPADI